MGRLDHEIHCMHVFDPVRNPVLVEIQPLLEARNVMPEDLDHDPGSRRGDNAPGAGEDIELHAFDVDFNEIGASMSIDEAVSVVTSTI